MTTWAWRTNLITPFSPLSRPVQDFERSSGRPSLEQAAGAAIGPYPTHPDGPYQAGQAEGAQRKESCACVCLCSCLPSQVMCAITLDAHNRDVQERLVRDKVVSADAFQWQSMLKCYWVEDEEGALPKECLFRGIGHVGKWLVFGRTSFEGPYAVCLTCTGCYGGHACLSLWLGPSFS